MAETSRRKLLLSKYKLFYIAYRSYASSVKALKFFLKSGYFCSKNNCRATRSLLMGLAYFLVKGSTANCKILWVDGPAVTLSSLSNLSTQIGSRHTLVLSPCFFIISPSFFLPCPEQSSETLKRKAFSTRQHYVPFICPKLYTVWNIDTHLLVHRYHHCIQSSDEPSPIHGMRGSERHVAEHFESPVLGP